MKSTIRIGNAKELQQWLFSDSSPSVFPTDNATECVIAQFLNHINNGKSNLQIWFCVGPKELTIYSGGTAVHSLYMPHWMRGFVEQVDDNNEDMRTKVGALRILSRLIDSDNDEFPNYLATHEITITTRNH